MNLYPKISYEKYFFKKNGEIFLKLRAALFIGVTLFLVRVQTHFCPLLCAIGTSQREPLFAMSKAHLKREAFAQCFTTVELGMSQNYKMGVLIKAK